MLYRFGQKGLLPFFNPMLLATHAQDRETLRDDIAKLETVIIPESRAYGDALLISKFLEAGVIPIIVKSRYNINESYVSLLASAVVLC